MKIGNWGRLLIMAAPLLSGCAGFWDAPSGSGSFTLTNSGNISVTPGATTGNTSTITVTPATSFTGTVSLACSITSAPSGATSATTCSLSPTSVAFTTATAQTSTLSAATTASTTAGSYQITVTGTSGSVSQTTNLCVQVSSSSGSCTATAGGNSGVFYVLNQGTKEIAGFSVVSGALTQVGNAFTFPSAPVSIAVAPGGGFLYVGTATGIYLFDISSNGSLTQPSTNTTTISQDVATTMQVVSTTSGSWLVEAGPNLGALLAIPINATTGVPTTTIEQSTLLPGATVQQLTVSPDNAHVFVALGSLGTEVVAFAAGSTTPFGAVNNIPAINLAGAALSVAVDPSSRLLYIGETAAVSATNTGGTGGLRVFNLSTLAEVTGSPFATGGLAPSAIVPTSYGSNKGLYVYVANRTVSNSSTGNIASFAVNTTGTTTTLSQLNLTSAAGINPVGLTQDSKGNYLLVVNSGGAPDLLGFTFDSTTAGKLDSTISSATGTDPVGAGAIAALP